MKERDEKVSAAHDDGDDEGPPPFGGSWTRLYALVLVNLCVLVLLFYLFTKAFG
ncbi:MAG TPA: hypothetical protein VGV38_12435 [Pyrinomonadaceae bacterium]|nr:hypothetical protein [Pyrinomonadaceae bacterium]